MKSKIPLLAIAILLCSGFGWFTKEKHSAPPADRTLLPQDLPAGYAILFKLLADEKDVSKLLVIKHESKTLHDLIKEISTVTGDAHKSLERFSKDGRINLKDQKLPAAEVSVRESISKEKAKQLLHAKGEDLQFRLLLSQSEALTYGRHLALVLAKSETESGRGKLLESLASQLEDLQDRVLKMLACSRSEDRK